MAKSGSTHVFRGKTFNEAVHKATSKLGKNINLVERRDVKVENLFSKITSGKLGGDSVEVELVVEVVDQAAGKKADGGGKAGSSAGKPGAAAGTGKPGPATNPLLDKSYAKAIELAAKRSLPDTFSASKPETGAAATGLAALMEEMKATLERVSDENRIARERQERENRTVCEKFGAMLSLQARGGLPRVGPELLEAFQHLLAADISDDFARELVEELEADDRRLAADAAMLRVELARIVASRIPSAGPIMLRSGKPTVVALIGPTGVGKSTTIAKLAVDFSMKRNKSVGLVNEDRSRPGADSQLKNLGQIFGLPTETADNPEKVGKIIRSMSGLDLILLDTGGRSPRDAEGLDELKRVIQAAQPDETHLVLSTCSSEKTVFETVNRFRGVGFDRLIFTKLDETETHGALITMAARLANGLSYVTTGQKYTESLVLADGRVLADLVTGARRVTDGGIKETAEALAGGGDAL